MAEEEKKTNDIMSVRETILSKYRQTGLSTKDAEEKTDSFIREQLFRPREGGVDLQMAGLLARFAEIERQQAEKISSAEKTAENVKEAPVQQAENVNEAAARQAENESEAQVRQPERKVPNEVTVNRYAADLKDITGADWAFKDAEHSGLKINNLSVASTPELLDKLEKRHIRYFPINKNGEKYVAVDTDQELHLTNDEINKASDRYEHDILKKFQTRAEQLKQITGKDWADNDKDNRIASSPELLATLEGKNVRYKSVKEGDQEFLSVDKDDFLFLSNGEKDKKRYREELNALTGADWKGKEKRGSVLRAPLTPELAARLEEKGVRYTTDDSSIFKRKRFLEVDTHQPLYLSNWERNKNNYADELKEITGKDWDTTWKPDPSRVFEKKEGLCIAKTPEMIAALEEKGIRYSKSWENENVIEVDLDKPLHLTPEEMQEKNKTKDPAVAEKNAAEDTKLASVSAEKGREAPAVAKGEDENAAEDAGLASAPVEQGLDDDLTDENGNPLGEGARVISREKLKNGNIRTTVFVPTPEYAAELKAQKEKTAAEKDAPVFSAGESLQSKVPAENAEEATESAEELEAQLLNTAWKNKFMHFENDEENEKAEADKRRTLPFSQLQPETIEKHDKPASVSMKTETGATVENASKRVHLNYEGDKPSFEDCMTMVRLGMEKGWKSAKLEGSEEYKAQMYLAMRAMGMKAIGYTPSPELEKQGDELAAQHAPDRDRAEKMDKRYPSLDKARDGAEFDKVDAKQYKAIRDRADEIDAGKANQAEEAKTAAPVEEEKAAAPVEEVKVAAPAAKEKAVAPAEEAKVADADEEEKAATLETPSAEMANASAEKTPEEKKAELSGKFEKMVSALREQHPYVARKQDLDLQGKSPAEFLKAYGKALNSVKESEAKGQPNKLNANIMSAMRNRSGKEK